MNSKHRKQQPAATGSQAIPEQREDLDQSAGLDEVIPETFSASDEVSPFVPAGAANLDNDDVESTASFNAGIEQAGASAPEQIDPGAKGAPQI